MGAPPLATIEVREKVVLAADIAPYVQLCRVKIPDFEKAFERATVLGRADGVFVLRLEFKPHGAFDEVKYLDELAWAACMA